MLSLFSSQVAFGAPPCSDPYNSIPATTPTLSPTPTPTPTPLTPSTPSNSSGNGLVSADDISAYLSAHNQVRAKHGAVNLTWSDDLSNTAQQWADGCVFKHSDGQYGENLAAGTGDYTIADAVGDWAAEVSQYDPNNPVYSHFTQIVWKSTTQVGCAVQNCSGIFDASYGPAQYYVCEYNPPGNVIGEFS
ncbi:CAP domain-containing protein [Lactarius quietus]|nr:CAP domain-containing protein [Lactarius quietus]